MFIYYNSYVIYYLYAWGLGIGDWAQSPIPNPQSPELFIISLSNYYYHLKL